jgi:hypothetical protein
LSSSAERTAKFKVAVLTDFYLTMVGICKQDNGPIRSGQFAVQRIAWQPTREYYESGWLSTLSHNRGTIMRYAALLVLAVSTVVLGQSAAEKEEGFVPLSFAGWKADD